MALKDLVTWFAPIWLAEKSPKTDATQKNLLAKSFSNLIFINFPLMILE